MPSRIAINALYLIPGKVGGTEIYLRNVLRVLAEEDRANEYFVFRNRETGPDLVPATFHDCPQQVSGENRVARILYEQIRLPRELTRIRADVVFNAGFTAPLLWTSPQVTVFHDLQYKHHPEFFRWFDLPFWRVLLPLSAKRSERLVVLSNAVKNDLIRFYNYDPARITVIPHAIESEFERIRDRRQASPPQTRMLLSVSTLHPHKNVDGLLRAFKTFHASHPEWRLVIAGLKGFEAERIERLRSESHLEASTEITGWIPREDLYSLFAQAQAFVYPSRFEGFGIPVLEALTAGVPVACSRLPSLVEIAGDSARYFNPDSDAEIVAALEDVTSNQRFRPIGRSSAREIARRLIDVFQDAATRSKNSHDRRAISGHR
jgi:glycosyltransferase involved in cell wall biosynthesis